MTATFRLRSLWTGVLALLAGTPGYGQGTIAYFQPIQPIPVAYNPIVFPPAFYDFDVDQNGTIDYRFNLADGFGVSVEPTGANRQIAVPNIPPDLGSQLDPLPAGFAVGSSLSPAYSWVNRDSPNMAGQSLLSTCADVGGNYICLGLFHGEDAYMGIEFRRGNDIHYGWVHINNPAGQAGGFILEWAYETQPSLPILAGVPEPSAWALLGIGGLLFWWYGRRKRKGKSAGATSHPDSQFESHGLRRRALIVGSHGCHDGGAAVAHLSRSFP